MSMKKKDRTGERVGRLLILGFAHRIKNKRYYWNCRCDCGKELIIRLDNKTQSCGCLRNEIVSAQFKGKPSGNRIKTAEKHKRNTINRVFNQGYSDGDLTLEVFEELSQLQCFYCNTPPSNYSHEGMKRDGTPRIQTRKEQGPNAEGYIMGAYHFGDAAGFKYNGLDRVDQTQPHNRDNVVPCCKRCNFMKSKLSLTEFITHIERIFTCLKTKDFKN